MKQAYTKYNPLLLQQSKKYGISYDKAHKLIQDDFLKRRKKGIVTSVDLATVFKSLMEFYYVSGNCLHIYIESRNFYEWLITCYKEKIDEISICKLPTKNIINKIDDGIVAVHMFCFHFPSNSGLGSVLCALDMSETFCDMNETRIYISLGYPLPKVISAKLDEALPEKSPEIIKFIGGLAQYINCFPETVKQGVPENLKHPSQHKSENPVTVGIAHSVRPGKGEHASPCGHFRRGHFKTLRSEFYKKKRGQTVFVRETFVKGEAVTVLEPESEELNNANT